MKLAELADKSGVRGTTIHHYLREGLLPEPRKTAPNAAQYGEEHLNRLQLVRWLQTDAGGRLPIARIKRVLQLVEQGVPVEVAAALQKSVLGGAQFQGDPSARFDIAELASASGLSLKQAHELVDAGLLRASPRVEDAKPFDLTDVNIACVLAGALRETGLSPSDGKPLAELVVRQSRIEFELRNRAVAGRAPDEAASRALLLQKAINQVRTYLFARAREHEIEELES